MAKFTKRQLAILEYIRKQGYAGNREIQDFLGKQGFEHISRVSIVRDIAALLKAGLIEKAGGGRETVYKEFLQNKLLTYFDPEDYFKKGPDERVIAYERFNFGVFESLNGIFTPQEITELETLNNDYKGRVEKLSPIILKKEFERLTIDLSWKSSQIEGNTYSLIDTEILIKEHKEAEGHKKEEAIMIINHKKTLDYVSDRRSNFRKVDARKIENVQSLIVNNLGILKGIRRKIVGVVGTKYKPLDNEHQIKEALEKAVAIINDFNDPFSKAITAVLMISYIQPFEDGNKRTARLLGDALLLAYNTCPLSFRSVNESDYKKATILFYEQNSAKFFKELFIQQFKFAVKNYFL